MTAQAFIGAAIGAVFGFGWYKLAGCRTGACPLTGNPFVSTLYGIVVGVLIATGFH